MKMFRYVYAATFLFAAAIAFIVDLPLWAKLVVLAWTAAPALINEYQLKRRATAAAERAEHSSTSLQDQMMHAYKENSWTVTASPKKERLAGPMDEVS